GREALLAKEAGAVGIGERHDHHLPAFDPVHVAADVLHHADRFVTHALALDIGSAVVRPQVAAADARAGDADHRIGRLPDGGVGDVIDADLVSLRHDGCAHFILLPRDSDI